MVNETGYITGSRICEIAIDAQEFKTIPSKLKTVYKCSSRVRDKVCRVMKLSGSPANNNNHNHDKQRAENGFLPPETGNF